MGADGAPGSPASRRGSRSRAAHFSSAQARNSPAGLRSLASGSPSKKAPKRALMPRIDELVRPTTRPVTCTANRIDSRLKSTALSTRSRLSMASHRPAIHRLVALDHGRGEEARRGPALSPVLAPLLVKNWRPHLEPVCPSSTKTGLMGSVRSPQDLPGDREGPDHPPAARPISYPLKVGPSPYPVRLELAGRVTSDHDSSLPVRIDSARWPSPTQARRRRRPASLRRVSAQLAPVCCRRGEVGVRGG